MVSVVANGLRHASVFATSLATAAVTIVLVAAAGLLVRDVSVSALVADMGAAQLALGLILPPFGALILQRDRLQPVGWILLWSGAWLALSGAAEGWAHAALAPGQHPLPLGVAASWVQSWAWIPGWAPLTTLLLLAFPDEAPWRGRHLLAWVSAAFIVGATILVAAATWHLRGPVLAFAPDDDPRLSSLDQIAEVVFPAQAVLSLASIATLALRFRHATGLERRQLACVAYAAAIALAISGTATALELQPWGHIFALLALLTGLAAAIFRYRLYAIDRLFRRTIVYGLVTASLTVLVALIAVGLGISLATVGNRRACVVAALTALVVAASLGPARARLQDLVDRRFARRRYDAVRTVRRFDEQLQHGVVPVSGIRDTLAEALQDPSLQLRFPLVGGGWATELGIPVDAPDATLPSHLVQRDGRPVALLLHAASLAEERPLLDAVTGAAALALENARLTIELQAQLGELAASRARIVAAQEAERRRVERDIHDGAQQRLVALAVRLRTRQRELGGRLAPEATAAFDDAVDELQRSIAELRELDAVCIPRSSRRQASRARSSRSPVAAPCRSDYESARIGSPRPSRPRGGSSPARRLRTASSTPGPGSSTSTRSAGRARSSSRSPTTDEEARTRTAAASVACETASSPTEASSSSSRAPARARPCAPRSRARRNRRRLGAAPRRRRATARKRRDRRRRRGGRRGRARPGRRDRAAGPRDHRRTHAPDAHG